MSTMDDDEKPRGRVENLTAPRFKPGQSGNSGRTGARNKIQTAFLIALQKDFDAHGVDAIARARAEDPMGYVKVVASLLPKQVEETKPLDDMTDGEIVAGIAFLKAQLAGGSGEGAIPPSEPQSTH